MSAIGNFELRAHARNTVRKHVQISFGASGAPTIARSLGGAVATVVRAAAGRYTITFDQPWAVLDGMDQMHDYQGTATDGQWQVYTGYVAATGVVVLSHAVAGVETDPASGDVVDLGFYVASA